MRAVVVRALLAGVVVSSGSALWNETARAEPLALFAPASQPAVLFDRSLREQDAMIEPEERSELPAQLRRQIVNYPTREPVGTIIVDTPNTYIYYVLGNGRAIRYGVGVGRDGFRWSGVERVSRMAEWPDWVPPPEMISRQPYLPRFMAGGESNPLGARALYLGNTAYRIHGTNAPSTIGRRVSSGCIRMLNEDVIDLYKRVNVGTKVVVLPDTARANAAVRPTAAVIRARAESDLRSDLRSQ
ncbi:MAG TPA: L,D-transpeptidase [Xanthobacteraceae bacterium]|nr:L,D-transpeptidase [Xanthobacteraceae bacterium]